MIELESVVAAGALALGVLRQAVGCGGAQGRARRAVVRDFISRRTRLARAQVRVVRVAVVNLVGACGRWQFGLSRPRLSYYAQTGGSAEASAAATRAQRAASVGSMVLGQVSEAVKLRQSIVCKCKLGSNNIFRKVIPGCCLAPAAKHVLSYAAHTNRYTALK